MPHFINEAFLLFTTKEAIGARTTIPKILNASTIKMEFPLTNGDKPILDLRPQDPKFQEFVRHYCK